MKFSDFGLASPILAVLEREGYTAPTPIQGQAIPPVLAGSDVLGIAQTGTGKTAAFALPILTRLAAEKTRPQRRTCRALILSPTRELASQIAASFETYGEGLGLTVVTIFGGVSHGPQSTALNRGVDIVVATPGRLLDHVAERNLDLSGTGIFVLDEADQMLDLGFVLPIRRVVAKLPARRQSLFFSATMPREIATLASELLRDPIRIAVTPVATTAERVEQQVIHVETAKKRALLVELLADPAMARTLIFTRTKRGADKVANHLVASGIDAAAIHGNKSQRQREHTLQAFRDGKTRVLVATDIAARGIDIDAVTHVVNYELPEVPEAYVHRIGRTARAGASGRAISLCDHDETDLLRQIERTTRQQIPHTSRRNDPTLVATALAPVVRPSSNDGDGPRAPYRSNRAPSDRFASRPNAGPRARSDDRPQRDDRPRRDDRPQRDDRPRSRDAAPGADRSDRPDRSERPRSFTPRPSGPRPDRAPVAAGDGERRPFRPRDPQRDGDRPARAEKRSFSDRPRSSGPRDFTPRDSAPRDFKPRDAAPRDDRPAPESGGYDPIHASRDAASPPRFPARGPKPSGDRESRADRPNRDGDRPARADRPYRANRPDRDAPRGDRGPRPEGRADGARTFQRRDDDRPQRDTRGHDRPRGDGPSGPDRDRPNRDRPFGDRPGRDRAAGGPSDRPARSADGDARPPRRQGGFGGPRPEGRSDRDSRPAGRPSRPEGGRPAGGGANRGGAGGYGPRRASGDRPSKPPRRSGAE